MLLLRAVRERIGQENFRSGLRLQSFEQDHTRVTANFHDTETGAIVVDDGDILVGADGIHSMVRRLLYPDEGAPHFAKVALWRAAIDAEPFLDGHTMVVAGHYNQRIVVYPIGSGTKRGWLLTNWICQMTVSDSAPPRRLESARFRVHTSDVRCVAVSWLDVPALIRRTPEVYEFPLVDRHPVGLDVRPCYAHR